MLQRLVHGDHGRTYRILVGLLSPERGATVVELGCGTGSLARHWIADGFRYRGVDSDPGRIALARACVPDAEFYGGDVCDVPSELLHSQYFFIHGLLHHLDTNQCESVLKAVLGRPGVKLAVIEPYLPESRMRHPLWSLIAHLDEGRWIRTKAAWEQLYRPWLRSMAERSLWPGWPVHMIDALLSS